MDKLLNIIVLLPSIVVFTLFGNNIADVHKSSLHQRCCTLIIVAPNEH